MTTAFHVAAIVLLLSVALALLRVLRGPGETDRIMAVQLVGTGSVGAILALAAARQEPAMLDAALVAILLAAATVAAFAGARPASSGGGEEMDGDE